MSRCPKCQHELSQADLKSHHCPKCGHDLASSVPEGQSSPAPGKPKPLEDTGALPQAISGTGPAGMGLSSAQDPETWEVDSNARTMDVEELAAVTPPKENDLGEEDIVRMSMFWGEVEDETPSGMTIKSKEDDEVDPSGAPSGEFKDEFDADESSKTFSPLSEDNEQGVSSVGETFISDQFPPVNPEDSDESQVADDSEESAWSEDGTKQTFLSDEQRPRAQQDTPADSGVDSSYDQTFIADSFPSDDIDSQDLIDESAKTVPLSGEGGFLKGVKPGDPATTPSQTPAKDGDQADSTDKTLISNVISDDQYTDSGTEDGQRTDPLASEVVSGAHAIEGSGLTIQRRNLRKTDEPALDNPDYEIIGILGEGGMGTVFNARQTSIDRQVALKMLKQRSSSRKRDQHTKFLAEAVVTGELDHPNIVPIYDVGRDQNDALFYSMKNVTGNPWLDTIHQKSTHDNLEILMSVADAVAFAHARGVVHRDLKPENVMLGEFGEVLLMDWGLAMPTDKFRKQRGIVRSSSMGGTPAYMAPEMATGPIEKIGTHSDIYLLGAILFEIVTGRPPHRGKNAMKCLMSAARNKIIPVEHTGELIEIAYKAMSTEAKDRYKSVQEFQAAVRTYLAHSESITLATAAEDDLERAQASNNYEDYAKARFGFEEALKLWDGNKRARSSLGAARLAYAHCAKSNGDFDLAASLLDPQDLAHQKLKADIVKAREEREARQQRLETARRAGRAMLALLFIVVTGAAFWINSERAAAVEAEGIAVKAKEEADEQREIAEEAQKVEADLRKKAEDALKREQVALQQEADARKKEAEQRQIAEERRKQAVAQEIMSNVIAIYAEEQAQFAKEQEAVAIAAADAEKIARDEAEKSAKAEADARKDEERQRLLAEQQRQQAEAQKTFAGVVAIYAEEQAEFAKEQEGIAKTQEAAAIAAADAAKIAQAAAEKSATAEAAARKDEEKQRLLAEARQKEAQAQQVVASLNAIMADEQRIIAIEQEAIAVAAYEAAERARKVAEEAKIAEEREAYISKVGLAAAKIEENAFDAARDLLLSTNPRFRNWEWGYLMHLCEGYVKNYPSKQRLESLALIGDGSLFVVTGESGLVEIHSVKDGKAYEVHVAQGEAPEVQVPETTIQTIPLPSGLTVSDVAVSPNGRLIALATNDFLNGFIKIWDRDQNQFLSTEFGNPRASYESPEDYGRKLEASHMDPVVSVQFSNDGTKLLTSSLDRTARVWDVASGKQLVWLYGVNTPGHTGFVWQAIFCPNFAKDAEGKLIRDANNQLKPLPETQIITVSEDGTVLVWRDDTGRWQDSSKVKLLPAFRAHEGPIYAVACSADGQYVATAGFDRRVLVWRPADIPQIDQRKFYEMLIKGEPIPQTPYRELLGHNAAVRSLAIALPNGLDTRDLAILSGSDDNTIKVWNVDREGTQETIAAVKTFRGHGGNIRDCAFNPAGTWILSASHDKTAKRWSIDKDAKTEVYLVNGSPLDGHEDNVDAVGFSSGKGGHKVVTASRDNTARIYQLDEEQRWSPEYTLTEGHNNLIPSGVYFDDGKQLATAGLDNTARIWDVLSGTEKIKLTGTGYAGIIAVSADGEWVLTGGDNNDEENSPWVAKLWNIKDGQPEKPAKTFAMASSEITAVAFGNRKDAEGRLVFATADAAGRCSLWAWSGEETAEPTERKIDALEGRYAHKGRIVDLQFLPNDERLLSASYDTAVTQWSVATGQAVNRLQLSHPREVSAMDLSEDGRLLVTTCFDSIVRVWNVETAQEVRQLRPQGRIQTLVTNMSNQFSSKKVSNATLERAWNLLIPEADYQQFLKRGGWSQSVEELLNQIRKSKKLAGKNDVPLELAEQLAALFKGVSAADLLLPLTSAPGISPDGLYVLATNRTDRVVHGWRLPAEDAANTQPIAFTLDDSFETWSVAFSPVRTRTELAVLGFSDARQWQLDMMGNTVQKKPSITMNAQGEVASASFSPSGDYLVTGARDKAARVWSVSTGQGVLKLQGVHTGPVNATAWAPESFGEKDERYIVTASDDNTAVLWKLVSDGANGLKAEAVRTFTGHTAEVLDAAFSPDGQWLATVSNDQTLILWNTKDGSIVVRTEPQGDALLCVAVADDGQRVLTGSANNQATIWEVSESGKELTAKLLLQGHSAKVTDVAFSPLEDLNGDGKISEHESIALRAVTASQDNTVIVWDTRIPTYSEEGVPKANQVLTLKRHTRPVKAVRFSPDGRSILTGSEDRRAILWPTKDWMSDKLKELSNPEKPEVQEDLTVSTQAAR